MVEHRKRVKFEYKVKMPRISDLDPNQIVFDYDVDCDTLFIHFYGGPKPAVSVLTPKGSSYGYVRVNPETEEAVGIEVEYFLSKFIDDAPEFLSIAKLAGIPDELIRRTEQQIPKEQRQRIPQGRSKQDAIGALLGLNGPSLLGTPA